MSDKSSVTRRTSVAILAGLAACATFRLAAAAEDNSHQRRVSIAVLDFFDISPPGEISAREITEIIVSDLKASGGLVLIDSQGLVEDGINVIPHFDKWRGIDAQALVTGGIVRKPDQRIFVEFRLWDVATGQQLMGAQYIPQADDWRPIPHAIAQAILERLVGRS